MCSSDLDNEVEDTYAEANGLAAFNEAANNTLVKLTLTNAIITSGMINNWGYYIQDANAGAHLYCTGLDFEVGDVLNGVVYVKKNNQTMGARICMTEKTNAEELTITKNGTVTPVEGSITETNVDANKCRVIKLTIWNFTLRIISAAKLNKNTMKVIIMKFTTS